MSAIDAMMNSTNRPAKRPSAAPGYLMLAFMLTTVLVPSTILNKILFAILIASTFRIFIRFKSPRPELVMPVLFCIGIFLYGLIVAIPADNDHALAIQFFLAIFLLSLVHFVEHFHIDMDRVSEICGKAMVIVTTIYAVLALNPDLPFATPLVEWFNEISLSSSGEREFLESATTTLALGTAPFLFVPFCVVAIRLFRQFQWRDLIWQFLYASTIVTSGARGVIVVALIFLVLAALRLASPLIRILVVIGVSFTIIVIIPELLAYTDIFNDEEVSNNVKIGHFDSYFEALDWSGGLFGNGLGSYYFSMGKNSLVQHTEITPLDLARYVGIPLTFLFFMTLLLPRLKMFQVRGIQFIYIMAFFLYLVLSLTNPVLINSYGMLVVVWYWTKIRLQPDQNNNVAYSSNGANSRAALTNNRIIKQPRAVI